MKTLFCLRFTTRWRPLACGNLFFQTERRYWSHADLFCCFDRISILETEGNRRDGDDVAILAEVGKLDAADAVADDGLLAQDGVRRRDEDASAARSSLAAGRRRDVELLHERGQPHERELGVVRLLLHVCVGSLLVYYKHALAIAKEVASEIAASRSAIAHTCRKQESKTNFGQWETVARNIDCHVRRFLLCDSSSQPSACDRWRIQDFSFKKIWLVINMVLMYFKFQFFF